MKLLVLCLFAAVCRWCVADGSADATRQRRKLEEVLRQLSVVKTRLQVGPSGVPLPFQLSRSPFRSLYPFFAPPEKREDARHAVGEHPGTDAPDGSLLKGFCQNCGRLVIVGLPPSASATVATRQMCANVGRFYSYFMGLNL